VAIIFFLPPHPPVAAGGSGLSLQLSEVLRNLDSDAREGVVAVGVSNDYPPPSARWLQVALQGLYVNSEGRQELTHAACGHP